MRLARLGLIFSFAALVLSNTSLGALLLTANYSLRSEAQDLTLFTNAPIVLAQGGVSLEVTPGPFEFTEDATAEHGTATASVFATVHAQKGKIGVGLEGSIFSAGGPFSGGVITGASGGNVKATARAGWMEFVVPKVKNKPAGQVFVVDAFILLDGSFGADITGGPHNLPGQVHSFLEFFEDSTNSQVLADPASPPFWGAQHEAPGSGLHSVVLPPGVIQVKHVMSNGAPYTFDTAIKLSVDAHAANGGTTSFSADFSTTLKWGGIVSVTDTDGNVIPRDEWSIESESGFDYAKSFDQQVPEPASILLLGIAMLGLALHARVLRRT